MKLIKQIETYITKYATLAQDYYTLPLALWAIHTHCWPIFDSTPYLVISALVAQSGKTRLMELMTFICSNSSTFSPDSVSSMFRACTELHPSMFIDEAEKLNAENHPAREMLNKGYRKGQFITRVVGGQSKEFDCYCPKAFVLIGDVYSTLRDRTITVLMRRRTPVETSNSPQFRMSIAKDEGAILREQISELVQDKYSEFGAAYMDSDRLDFLSDRDEEIWQSLFAIARILCPERIEELKMAAVDMSTEKQVEARKESKDEKDKADLEFNKVLLLKDMLLVTQGRKYIPTSHLLLELKEIPTSQWRRYKGRGLTDIDLGVLVDALGIHPRPIRVKSGKHTEKAILRGYAREDLLAAAKLVGLV